MKVNPVAFMVTVIVLCRQVERFKHCCKVFDGSAQISFSTYLICTINFHFHCIHMYFSYHRYHHGCLDIDYNFLPFQVSVCKLILTTSTCHRQHSWKFKRFSSICSCKCILLLYYISSRRCHLCLCSLKQEGVGGGGVRQGDLP